MIATLALVLAAQQPTSHLNRLFPDPNGRNAYEDLMRAVDFLDTAENWELLTQIRSNPTGLPRLELQQKLAANSQPALAWIEQSTRKPISYPGDLGFDTLLPEMRFIFRMDTVLEAVIEARFASGDVSGAYRYLEVLYRTSLKMFHMGPLLYGLAGQRMVSTAGRILERHGVMLSVGQWRSLYELAGEIKSERLVAAALESELGLAVAFFENALNDPDFAKEALPEASEELLAILRDPVRRDRLLSEAKFRTNLILAKAREMESLPIKQWPAVAQEADNILNSADPSIRDVLQSVLSLSVTTMAHIAGGLKVHAELLEAYAGVNIYWWENQKWPEAISHIGEPELWMDPITERPFEFAAAERQFVVEGHTPFGGSNVRLSTLRAPQTDEGPSDLPPAGVASQSR